VDFHLGVGAEYVNARRESTDAFEALGVDDVRVTDRRWSFPLNVGVDLAIEIVAGPARSKDDVVPVPGGLVQRDAVKETGGGRSQAATPTAFTSNETESLSRGRQRVQIQPMVA
jgi:hypothetical protein